MSSGSLGQANIPIRATLDKLDGDLAMARSKVQGTVGSITKSIGTVGKAAFTGIIAGAGLAAVGVGLIGAAAFGVSNEVATATAAIEAQLGSTTEEAERLGDVAKNVWGNNFAGSITEAAEAVGLIRQQLGDLSDNELQRATENAFRLSDTFGIEIPGSVNAAKTLMEQFGLTSDQAFDFIAKGMQSGLNRSDDFLETIGEYSVQFASGGADAGQFFSLLESGLQGGMLGTDKAADAFKEFRVRIQDGSTATTEALEMIGLSSEEISRQMADGSLTAADAFALVTDALNNVDDKNIQIQAGVGLLGTQFEDLGTEGALALSMIGTSLEDMAGATDTMDAKYNNLSSVLEGFKRRGLLALEPVGNVLLDLANNAMPLVDKAFAIFETSIIPIFDDLANFINGFTTELGNGLSVWDAAVEALLNWTSAGEANFLAILNVVQGIEQFVAKVQEVLQPVVDMVMGFVSWEDVLITLGITLMAVIIPAMITLAGTILTIAAPIVAIIAIVALLRNVWENDWGGIKTFLTEAWEGSIKPVLDQIGLWITTILIPKVQELYQQWVNVIWPAITAKLQEAWAIIQPILIAVGDWIVNTLIPQVQEMYRVWVEEVWPVIQDVTENVWTVIKEVFTEIGRWINDNLVPWIEYFAEKWEEKLEVARESLDMVWAFIEPIFSSLREWMEETLPIALAALEGIWTGVMSALGGPVESVKGVFQSFIDAVKGFWDWISSHSFDFSINLPDLPDWAIPGSPLPIHTAWKDFSSEMSGKTIKISLSIPQVGGGSRMPSPTVSLAGTSDSNSGATVINVDARGATDPTSVEKAVERGIDKALAASGRRADVRIRTG